MKKHTKTYKFKKGQQLSLDSIYDIQGLAGGQWWDHVDGFIGDQVVILRNITIQINWWE